MAEVLTAVAHLAFARSQSAGFGILGYFFYLICNVLCASRKFRFSALFDRYYLIDYIGFLFIRVCYIIGTINVFVTAKNVGLQKGITYETLWNTKVGNGEIGFKAICYRGFGCDV